MAAQQKPKSPSKAGQRNDARPNGKAFKKNPKKNPTPPEFGSPEWHKREERDKARRARRAEARRQRQEEVIAQRTDELTRAEDKRKRDLKRRERQATAKKLLDRNKQIIDKVRAAK